MANPTTPPRPPPVYSQETPYVNRISNNLNFLHGELASRRTAVREDLPDKVRVVPIQDFEQHFLPRLKFTDEELEKIYQEVEPLSEQQGTHRKWKALDRPSNVTEPVLFANFAGMEQGILQAATSSTKKQPTVEFTSDGNAIPQGPWPEKARPDGTGMLVSKKHCTHANHWVNVFQAQEFKKAEDIKEQYDVGKVRLLGEC
jgi:hypothetical protein